MHRAPSDALRNTKREKEDKRAQRRGAVYGSCELQNRGEQLHVVSWTRSHAFPRDLRGSHPRNHGGNGEEDEDGVTPGQGYAAQRQGVGKKRRDSGRALFSHFRISGIKPIVSQLSRPDI